MVCRRLGRAVASAGALTASGFGLVFIDVLPDVGREDTRPLRRASVPGAFSVAGVIDGVRAVVAVDVDEPVVVLVCRPPELFTAPGELSLRG
jgi:hypothetical protein